MSEMVERVARAIAAADGVFPDQLVDAGSDYRGEPLWRLYQDQARAVIDALRNPIISAACGVLMVEFSESGFQVMTDERAMDIATRIFELAVDPD